MSDNVSRRTFIRNMGVAGFGAVGLTAAGGSAIAEEASQDPSDASAPMGFSPWYDYDLFAESRVVREDISPDDVEATYDYDVVVVGAGTAGTAAAFAAADKGGVKVAVLQNAATAISQGNMGSGIVVDASTPYAMKRFVHDWNVNNLYASDQFMVWNYVNYSGAAADLILELARESGFPEGNIQVMDDVVDYGDGEQITKKRVLFADKPITYGDAMQSISTIGPDHGVDYYFSTPGVKLVQGETGAVSGIYGLNEETGKYILFNASKGVILACGSFINNQNMLARYCTQGLGYTAKVSGRFGDGHLMGLLVGATMRNGGYSKMCHDNDSGPLADVPFLCVNDQGERFINEELDSTLWCNICAHAAEKGRYFRIFDNSYAEDAASMGVDRVPDEEGMLGYMPGTEQSNAKGAFGFFSGTYKADTLEELAEQLGLPADALVATVEHYNEICASGKDVEFGKKSEYLFPVDEPPFWGVHTWSRLSTILQGIDINEYQQVVNAEGNPIEGLYAAGNCSGTPGGQSDWTQVSLGESLGFAFTEGYVAGSHIVGALE